MTGAPSADGLYARVHAATGGRLFTATVLDRAAGLARRVYTSHPDTYPVSGTKNMNQGAWTDMVVDRGEVFVANTVAEFAIYFPDFETIESLGCASALNAPIGDGVVVGTINILDVENYFDPAVVASTLAAIDEHRADLEAAMAAYRL